MESNWFEFLQVRRRLINEFRTEGKSCTEIASTLSMDPGQVWLISEVEVGIPPEDARRAIVDYQNQCIQALKDGRIS